MSQAPKQYDERILIAAVRNGDTDAFAQLIAPLQRRIYSMCYDLCGSHDDAQDIAQEAFIKAYKGLPNFAGEAAFSTWMYRIAVNSWIDHKRRNSMRNMQSDIEAEDLLDDSTPKPDAIAGAALLTQYIEEAVGRLPPQQRAVFVLRHYQEFTIAETARLLDISEGTVKTLLFRSLKKLRELLQPYREQR